MRKIAVVLMLVSAAAYADTEVSYGTPIVRGSFDAKTVEATVKGSSATKSALVACADKAKLAASTTAQVTLTVAETGKLSTSATGSKAAELDTCIAAAFSTLAFDKPKDGKPVQIVVPTTLAPKAAVAKDAPTENRIEADPNGGLGTGGATIGMGTIGKGTLGTGSGFGVGGGGAPRRPSQPPLVKIGDPKVKGDLDKAIIRRYIKRHIQKLTYCYEKELMTKPKLKGTVTVTFTIASDGNVATSTATGLKAAPEVEACYGRVIQGIQFPKPKSGDVSVVYPFTLKPN